MLNSRGYITSAILFGVLTVSALIIGIFYAPLLNATFSLKQADKIIVEVIADKTAGEISKKWFGEDIIAK